MVVVVVCAGTEKGSRAGSWNTGGSEKREKEGSRVLELIRSVLQVMGSTFINIANFLLKPGTSNRQQKRNSKKETTYNRLKKKIVQNNEHKLGRNNNNWIREKRRSDGQKRNDGKIYILVRVAMTGDVNQVDRVAFPTKVWYGKSAMPFLSARANLGIRLEVDSSSESGRGTADKNTSYPPVVLARNQVPNPRVGAIFISCPEAADVIRRIARRESVAKGRESERGGEIPEKSPGIDGQDDADQSPSFVSRSLDPKPIRKQVKVWFRDYQIKYKKKMINLFNFKQIKQIDHFRKHAAIQQRATALDSSVEASTNNSTLLISLCKKKRIVGEPTNDSACSKL
ncbi:hypothetical protein G5I_07258 [Acromyrmex echinatior]|uniref:Uncharacterized protein n=1 Tax=Acromyrmex echinatior TaxID=103372 RepID=F4WNA6_ACREC|nr:hypothetical protein G5I_07258 [Acromyrmex echinatior]